MADSPKVSPNKIAVQPNRKISHESQGLKSREACLLPVGYALSPGDVAYFEADVVGARDFYPFGMGMPGRGFEVGGYRYGFNGKEGDDEVKGLGNSYDFGARMYDARVGRWLSVDPLESKYPGASGYCFALNTPVQAIDPDGADVTLSEAFKKVFGEAFFTLLNNSETFRNLLTNYMVVKPDPNLAKFFRGPQINLQPEGNASSPLAGKVNIAFEIGDNSTKVNGTSLSEAYGLTVIEAIEPNTGRRFDLETANDVIYLEKGHPQIVNNDPELLITVYINVDHITTDLFGEGEVTEVMIHEVLLHTEEYVQELEKYFQPGADPKEFAENLRKVFNSSLKPSVHHKRLALEQDESYEAALDEMSTYYEFQDGKYSKRNYSMRDGADDHRELYKKKYDLK